MHDRHPCLDCPSTHCPLHYSPMFGGVECSRCACTWDREPKLNERPDAFLDTWVNDRSVDKPEITHRR